MIEQTSLASELCPLVGVAAPGWGSCSLISILSHKKSPIFAQQLGEETEEPLGSRILVGYDNAHEDQAVHGGEIEGWMEVQRGRKGDGALKEEEEERGDEVVASADGWAGGLFCHI